jgi:hypothetical protein
MCVKLRKPPGLWSQNRASIEFTAIPIIQKM